MLIEYKTTTQEITGIHYGRADEDAEVSAFSKSGYTLVKLADEPTEGKYLKIVDGVESLAAVTAFDISASKSLITSEVHTYTYYSMISDNSDYIDFTDVPEGTSIYVDDMDTTAATGDASGTFRFKATEAGTYGIKFYKIGYNSMYLEVKAHDNV